MGVFVLVKSGCKCTPDEGGHVHRHYHMGYHSPALPNIEQVQPQPLADVYFVQRTSTVARRWSLMFAWFFFKM